MADVFQIHGNLAAPTPALPLGAVSTFFSPCLKSLVPSGIRTRSKVWNDPKNPGTKHELTVTEIYGFKSNARSRIIMHDKEEYARPLTTRCLSVLLLTLILS
jgi:hypothetical protein